MLAATALPVWMPMPWDRNGHTGEVTIYCPVSGDRTVSFQTPVLSYLQWWRSPALFAPPSMHIYWQDLLLLIATLFLRSFPVLTYEEKKSLVMLLSLFLCLETHLQVAVIAISFTRDWKAWSQRCGYAKYSNQRHYLLDNSLLLVLIFNF